MKTAALQSPVQRPLPIRIDRLERWLLACSALFMSINTLALYLVTERSGQDWLHLAAWTASAALGHIWLRRRLPHRDPLLFPLAMFLSGWSMIMIERLAPVFADRQTLWIMVGCIALCIVSTWPKLLSRLRAYRYSFLVVGLGLLLLTILFGVNPTGQETAPQLWLGFGQVFFQPSELLKIILVVFLSSYLAEQYPVLQTLRSRGDRAAAALSPRVMGPVLLMFGLSVVVLVWQRDLGTAALFFIVFLLMLYLATGFGWLVPVGTLLFIMAGTAAYQLFAVVRLRIDIWLNPWLDPDGRAFQIVQSLFAFASGGVFGRGIGQGSPTFIPVVHSDFAFAALAEEWGLLGVIVLITSIAVLTTRGMRIAAQQSQKPYHSLMAAGLSILIAVQALLIAGGVLKLIPLTGVTMPFISYGGSSMLVNFIIIGLLLRLSAEEGERGAGT